ncbi:hypothetical protein GQ457_11G025670 [Hibiscus cannabinus]
MATSSSSSAEGLPSRFSSATIKERYHNIIDAKNIWEEQGFLFDDALENYGLEPIIYKRLHDLRWLCFGRQPARENLNWVREFYAHNAEGNDTTYVRRRRVPGNSATINNLLNLPNDNPNNFELIDILENEDFNTIRDQLCEQGIECNTRGKKPGTINRPHLYPELKLWNIFVKRNMMPTCHNQTVDRTRLVLINAIITGYKFNVGKVIARELSRPSRTTKAFYPSHASSLPSTEESLSLPTPQTSPNIRDQTGNFILAYHQTLGRMTVLQAELWGVLEGLNIAWSNGYDRLIIQINNSEVHQLLSPPSTDNPLALVRNIVEFYNKAWFVEFALILREANDAVNFMAKFPPRHDAPLTVDNTAAADLATAVQDLLPFSFVFSFLCFMMMNVQRWRISLGLDIAKDTSVNSVEHNMRKYFLLDTSLECLHQCLHCCTFCMTRGNSQEPLYPLISEIERLFHQRMRENKTQRAMNRGNQPVDGQNDQHVDGNARAFARPRAIRDHLTPILDDLNPRIVAPDIQATYFELKPVMFNMLNSIGQFGGSPHEDARQHIRAFLEVCDSFRQQGVHEDVLKLKVFSYSLRDRTRAWLSGVPAGSMESWVDLCRSFLMRYNPPNMHTQLRNDVASFRQADDESMYKCWDKYKGLLRKCTNHGYQDWTQVVMFYNGVNALTRMMLDALANGTLLDKSPEEAFDILDRIANNDYQFPTARLGAGRRVPGKLDLDANDSVSAQLSAITNRLKNLLKPTDLRATLPHLTTIRWKP